MEKTYQAHLTELIMLRKVPLNRVDICFRYGVMAF